MQFTGPVNNNTAVNWSLELVDYNDNDIIVSISHQYFFAEDCNFCSLIYLATLKSLL